MNTDKGVVDFVVEVFAEWSSRHPKGLGYPEYEKLSFPFCPRVGDTLVFSCCCWKVVEVYLRPSSSFPPIVKVEFSAYN